MTNPAIQKLLDSGKEIWLEVGSGKRPGRNGWLSVDMSPKCDIHWDLRNGIPFPDNSVQKIYSSHFLEHLSFSEGQRFIIESKRVLSRGGNFSICVPNARHYIEAYMNPDKDISTFFKFKPAYFNSNSRIDFVNYMAYMNGHHKCMFDEDSLVNRMTMAGFANARLREFDPNLDLLERDYESIYGIADKLQ